MKVGAFLSNYLRAADVKDPITVTVSSVEAEEIGREGERQKKLVVYFQEIDQGLVLCKENINRLIELSKSDDSDKWVGLKITLYFEPKVKYGGKNVGGIRIK